MDKTLKPANPALREQVTVSSPDGHLLRAKRVDHSKLAPLRHLVKPGIPPFNLKTFREQGYEKNATGLIPPS